MELTVTLLSEATEFVHSLDVKTRDKVFWDKKDQPQNLIICTHGLLKATAKTPKGEIEHAEQLKTLYFSQRKKRKH